LFRLTAAAVTYTLSLHDALPISIGKELFAVLGMVTARGEARTVGIVYVVRERKLYVATGADTWKARHVAANPNVSITIPIAKRRSEEHTSELQSRENLVCRLLLE